MFAKSFSRPLLLAFLLCACVVAPAAAQEQMDNVAAKVSGELITRLDVERAMREALQDRPIAEEALPYAQAAALDQAINRRLVLAWLQTQKIAATPEEIEQGKKDFARNLEFQGIEREAYLQREKLTEESLLRTITWDIAWGRYLRQQITLESRQKFFDEHRRAFDGSQLHVAHILFGDESASLEDRQAVAALVKSQIAAKKLTFGQAVDRYSAGTKENEGDLGFIERHGVMPEAFAAAAFALQPGEISDPVTTPFGVHLIRLLDVKPGSKELKDVVDQVDKAFTLTLLDALVKQVRGRAKIEFTGSMPHLDPNTCELVPASK